MYKRQDRGVILENIMNQAVMTYQNWEVTSRTNETVLLTTADDRDARDIPARLRVANRPVTGTWRVQAVAPGNTINIGIDSPNDLTAESVVVTNGTFSVETTPSYLGVLVSNPALAGGLEFLLLEAGRPTSVTASIAVASWVSSIRADIPRVSLVTRTNGFFLQPANYDSLANFVLDVRINDTPENADWMYRILTEGINPDPTAPTQTGIVTNSASAS